MSHRNQKSYPLRVGLISLGCAKNLVDAEIMLGALLKEGIEITSDDARADVMIVNTCSFIDAAQEESVDTILESAAVREAQHRGQGLVVSGCLSQRFRDQLPELFPEVDAFMGIDQVAQVGRVVRQALERRREKVRSPKSEVRRKSVNRNPKRPAKRISRRPRRWRSGFRRVRPARSASARFHSVTA
jgi:ribosomal protein S12 methylthiotransferase